MEHLTKVGLKAIRKKEPLEKTKFKRDPKKVMKRVPNEEKAEKQTSKSQNSNQSTKNSCKSVKPAMINANSQMKNADLNDTNCYLSRKSSKNQKKEISDDSDEKKQS